MKNTLSLLQSQNSDMEENSLGSKSKIRICTKVDKGRWKKEEHELFLKGLKLYGRDWKKIEVLVGSRTGPQIRSHAQKYFNRIGKEGTSSEETSELEVRTPKDTQRPEKGMNLRQRKEENKNNDTDSAFSKVSLNRERQEAITKQKLDIPPINLEFENVNTSILLGNSAAKGGSLNENDAFLLRKENPKSYTEEEVLLLLKYLIKEFASIMGRIGYMRQPSLLNCVNSLSLNSLLSFSLLAGDQSQVGGIASSIPSVVPPILKDGKTNSIVNSQNFELTNLLIQSLKLNSGSPCGDDGKSRISKLSDLANFEPLNKAPASVVAQTSQSEKLYCLKSDSRASCQEKVKSKKPLKKYDDVEVTDGETGDAQF